MQAPLGIQNIFRSLQYRNYRLFFGGQSLSLIGTWVQRIAVPWLVYHLTGSAYLLGLVGFASQVPTFLLAPFAGALTDRWDRYRILLITQLLSMVQALTLALLYYSGTIQIWHIVTLSVLLGAINAFDIPARQSLVVEMVERKEDLGNAIALNSTMVNGARLLGPSVAGLLIASLGEGICFLLNGISYGFVLLSLLLMRLNNRPHQTQRPGVWSAIKEGFGYSFGFPPIRAILLLLALISLMGMPYVVLMPVFAKEILHGGSHTFGFLIGGSGLGALSGALYLASRRSVLGLESLLPRYATLFGLGLIAFALSRNIYLSFVLMVLTGAGMMLQMAASNTIIQTLVDNDKRGRVMSIFTMAFMGTVPFGSYMAGSLAAWWGAPNTILLGGVCCLVGAAWFANRLPTLRRQIRPILRARQSDHLEQ